MSTRACIKIKERVDENRIGVIYLYHHSDGYPDGIGAELKQWLGHHNDNLWKDKDIIWDIDSIANELVNGAIKRKDDDTWDIRSDMGYQVTFGQHGDENYGYEIDCDSLTLKCYELGIDQFEWKEEDLVEIPDNPCWVVPEPKPIRELTDKQLRSLMSEETTKYIMSFRSADKLNSELVNACTSLNVRKAHHELNAKQTYYCNAKIEFMQRRLSVLKEREQNKPMTKKQKAVCDKYLREIDNNLTKSRDRLEQLLSAGVTGDVLERQKQRIAELESSRKVWEY